jgi:hypothetical protein
MVYDGTQVFMLGGAGVGAGETAHIHVLKTGMYFFLSFHPDNLQV